MKKKHEPFYCDSLQMSLDKKDRIKNQSLFENLTMKDAASTKVVENRARTIEYNMSRKGKERSTEVKSIGGAYTGSLQIQSRAGVRHSMDVSDRGEQPEFIK